MRRPESPSEIVEMFLWAYRQGAFPMADLPEGPTAGEAIPVAASIQWYQPDPRAILPLGDGGLHVPRTVGRLVRRRPFELTSDRAFEQVIRGCARPGPTRGGAWLDESLIRAYTMLHRSGHAHSIEAWKGGRLVGGIYGVSIGSAFFAESMFSDIEGGGSGASSVCLVTLWGHLRACGYSLLDVQLANEHTLRFGVVEIPLSAYMAQLGAAVDVPSAWRALGGGVC
jgi:leucyl/phenylalanyl-tRNA--protein transferase